MDEAILSHFSLRLELPYRCPQWPLHPDKAASSSPAALASSVQPSSKNSSLTTTIFTAVSASSRRTESAKSDRSGSHRACGDPFDPRALDEGFTGCDVAIHLIGIIRENPKAGVTFDRLHVEATQNMVAAARRAGVRRFIHMSALGARANAVSNYHKTKFQAEELLRQSGFDYTIFRPSHIHGPGGEFLKMEAAWARGKRPPFLFMPYFGGGLLGLKKPSLVQPVHVKDVARRICRGDR